MTNYQKEKDRLSELATKQQHSAAEPHKSVWVEASAGTGKTKVLSDRVLRLLLSKVDPAKILCLTYTKAAAVEMNERIAKRLSEWAILDTQELEKELIELLGEDFTPENKTDLLNFARTLFAVLLDTRGGMKIQTIHSFCQDILKRFPLEAGISPYFEILDNRGANEILQNIKLDLLKQIDCTDNADIREAIIYLTQNISESSFPNIMNLITENRSKISSLFQFYNNNLSLLLNALEKKLGISEKTTEEALKTQVMQKIDRATFRRAIDTLLQGGPNDIKNAQIFIPVGESDFSWQTYDLYKFAFLKKSAYPKAKEVKSISNLASKNAIKLFPEILNFMLEQAEIVLSCEEKLVAINLFQSTKSILLIAKHIIDSYNSYKQFYATFDYEDLIIITRHLLENPEVADWVLFKLDGGIDHILIDEAQDTSPNQWAIIRAITREFFAGLGNRETETPRTVFVVGDRKQSIYSFQGADPAEFDRMYHYFNSQSPDFSKVQLDVSFRSTKAVMDCVNILFEDVSAKKGVIPLDEHINHLPYRLGDGGQVEILPLLHAEKEEKIDYSWYIPTERIQKTSLSNQLAKQIAQNIKTMVENGDVLESKDRPLRYGDFMFLVQKRDAFVEEFVRACKDLGVNVSGVDKLKLLEQIAVQDLISLGKFLLLPSDDLSLAEVLKSPIFMLDDDDLINLCPKRKSSLFNSLLANPNYTSVAEKLKTLLNMSGFSRPFELFNYVLVNLEGRKNYISRMGTEVDDVLDEFLNLTIAFEQKHTPALETFISWIGEDEVVIKKEMEQGDSDTVKIMTVHGSKGLQAPVVILADAARVKTFSSKSNLLWSNDNLVYFPTASANYDTNCQAIHERNQQAECDEYRRLLYVALTRAEDRLYVAGFEPSKKSSTETWYTLLENNIKSNIPLDSADKRIVYAVPQENDSEDKHKNKKPKSLSGDFSHLFTPAPMENPLAKPYTPSRGNPEDEIVASPLADNGHFYKRGTAIHKLLQYICNVSVSKREAIALEFISKQLPDLSSKEHQQIVMEVLNLCNAYPDLFSSNSMAEVPIIGELGGKIISAKVDRLVVTQDKVMIVDYKTNRPAAEKLDDVPSIYINQMSTYKSLLQRIYSDKEVETYLLWTNTCNMMKV